MSRCNFLCLSLGVILTFQNSYQASVPRVPADVAKYYWQEQIQKALDNNDPAMLETVLAHDRSFAKFVDPDTGVTLLMGCAGLGNLDMVRVLVKYGADVNAAGFVRGDTFKAINFAIQNGHVEIVKFLLQHGSSALGVAFEGRSLLPVKRVYRPCRNDIDWEAFFVQNPRLDRAHDEFHGDGRPEAMRALSFDLLIKLDRALDEFHDVGRPEALAALCFDPLTKATSTLNALQHNQSGNHFGPLSTRVHALLYGQSSLPQQDLEQVFNPESIVPLLHYLKTKEFLSANDPVSPR